jgi:hypothetical protein
MRASTRLKRPAGERRPAVWPWLLMPAIVLAVYCALLRLHHPREDASARALSAGAVATASPSNTQAPGAR